MHILKTSLAMMNGQILEIGRQGEHNARQVTIGAGAWKTDWPEGELSAAILPEGAETAQSTRVYWEGDQVIWPITQRETAQAGTGRMELRLVSGGAVVKSAVATYRVTESPSAGGVEPLPSGGDAETAERLLTPRKIQLTGDATGETLFDGSQDVTIEVTVTGGKADLTALTEEEVEAILDE